MRRQGQDVMQVNLAGIRRDIMNLAHNYSNAQVIKIFRINVNFFKKTVLNGEKKMNKTKHV